MQISLVNVADDNNRGSCALTWAAIDLLRLTFPEAGLTIIPLAAAPAPPAAFRHTARRFPDVRFVAPISAGRQQTDFGRGIRLLHKSVAALRVRADSNGGPDDWLSAIRRSDLVVARGGLSIHAYYNSIRGDLGFVERMSPLLAARRLRRPIVLLGAQIGPFTTVPRFLFRRIASDASAVARDTVSMATLLDFVPASRVLLAPDTVFAMVDEQTDVTQVFTSRGLDPTRPTLALVVTSTLRREESVAQHVALFAPAVRAMRDAGSVAQVIVVVQAAEDRAASWQLAALLGLSAQHVVDDDLDPQQLIALYRACHLVVSSRLHGVILALVGGTPAISLAPAVTFKERAVLRNVGLEELCVATTDASACLGEVCVRVARDRADYVVRIRAAVEAARHTLRSEVPRLLQRVQA